MFFAIRPLGSWSTAIVVRIAHPLPERPFTLACRQIFNEHPTFGTKSGAGEFAGIHRLPVFRINRKISHGSSFVQNGFASVFNRGKGPRSTKLQGKLGILLFFNNTMPLPQGKTFGTARCAKYNTRLEKSAPNTCPTSHHGYCLNGTSRIAFFFLCSL